MTKLALLTGMIAAAAIAGTAHAGSVAHNSSLAAPGVYFGAGNEGTNHGWTVYTDGAIELGLTTIHRSVGAVDPTWNNVYNVPTGNNAPDGPTNRAWWNFDFSVNLDAGGAGSLTLGDVTASLKVYDFLHNTVVTLDPFTAFDDNSAFDGTTTRNGNVTTPAQSTDVGYQNSENLTFGQFSALGFDFDQNDTFRLTLSLFDLSGNSLGSVSEQVVVGTGASAVPLPATLPLFASGLGVMGWFARRKRKAVAA